MIAQWQPVLQSAQQVLRREQAKTAGAELEDGRHGSVDLHLAGAVGLVDVLGQDDWLSHVVPPDVPNRIVKVVSVEIETS